MPLPLLALLAHDLPPVFLHIVCDFASHITCHEAMYQLGINTQLDLVERLLRDQNDVDQKIALGNLDDAIQSALDHENDFSAEDCAHLTSAADGRVGNYDSVQLRHRPCANSACVTLLQLSPSDKCSPKQENMQSWRSCRVSQNFRDM